MSSLDSQHPSKETLSAFINEEIDDERERRKIEAHIDACAKCDSNVQSLLQDPLDEKINIAGSLVKKDEERDAPDGSVETVHQPATTSQEKPLDEVPSALANHPDFEVLEKLGAGGMGVVYKAFQRSLKRTVVIKTLLAGFRSAEEYQARFRTEAEAAARLQHVNIVQIYDVGEQDGQPFMVLEYVKGPNLADRLNGTPQAPDHAAQLVETLAQAIHFAHRQGIIHRDLKPANILLTRTESIWQSVEKDTEDLPLDKYTAKITDFGLAKLTDANVLQTQTGKVMGTPSYMAPEQAEGSVGAVGPAADIYALGAILYELLTGRPPFKGPSVWDTIGQVIKETPVPPRGLQPQVPRDAETICLKCLSKEPAKRYASAAELADDLRRFQKGEPINARPVGRFERYWRWCRRNPKVAALSAAVLFCLIGIAVTGPLVALREGQLRLAAREAEGQANAEKENLRRQLYYTNIALAEREIEGGNTGRAADLLKACPLDMRDWEWEYLNRLQFGKMHPEFSPIKPVRHKRGLWMVDFSPDSKRVASSSMDGTVGIWDTNTGQPLQIIVKGTLIGDDTIDALARATAQLLLKEEFFLPMYCARFHPDGSILATAGVKIQLDKIKDIKENLTNVLAADALIKIWDPKTGEELQTLSAKDRKKQFVFGMAFSPDRKSLAVGGSGGEIVVWDTTNGKELKRWDAHANGLRGLEYHPTDDVLASGGFDGTIVLWDAKTGRRIKSLLGHKATVSGIAFGQNGTRLASSSFDGTIRIWDLTSGKTLKKMKGHTGPVTCIAYHPEGKRLASGGFDSTVRIWDTASGKEMLTLHGHRHFVWAVAFSPDGHLLGSGDSLNQLRIWNGKPFKSQQIEESSTIGVHDDLIFSIKFNPHGNLLASASTDNMVKIWDITGTGKEKGKLTMRLPHNREVYGITFSPKGDMLASACWDKAVRVWDITKGETVRSFPNQSHFVHSVAYSRDGRYVAGGTLDGQIKIWDVATGKNTLTLPKAHLLFVFGLAFSRDGKHLISGGGDRELKIWETGTGKLVHSTKHEAFIFCTAFSPDGKRFALGGGGKAAADAGKKGNLGAIKVFDFETRKEIARYYDHEHTVTGVAFSPDNRYLAASCMDGWAKIWDLNQPNKKEPIWMRKHTGLVTSIAFHPEYKWLATASNYTHRGELILWYLTKSGKFSKKRWTD